MHKYEQIEALGFPHHAVDQGEVRYFKPDSPFRFDTSARNGPTPLIEDVTRSVHEAIGWRSLPQFPMGVRTAEIRDPTWTKYSKICMKGIGIRGGDNLCIPPMLRTPFFPNRLSDGTPRLRTNFALDERGAYPDLVPIDPVGGAYAHGAFTEFDGTLRLREHGIPTPDPLFCVTYKDRQAFGQDTGAYIYGVPKGDFVRTSELYLRRDDMTPGPTPELQKALRTIQENPTDNEAQWKFLEAVEARRGKILFDMHIAGYHGIQMHPGNMSIDLDSPEQTLLHDAETLQGFSDSPPEATLMHSVIDVASAVFHIAMNSLRLLARGGNTLPQESNPVASMLHSYFDTDKTRNHVALLANQLWYEVTELYLRQIAGRGRTMDQVDQILIANPTFKIDNLRRSVLHLFFDMDENTEIEGSLSQKEYLQLYSEYESLSTSLQGILTHAWHNNREGHHQVLQLLADPEQSSLISRELLKRHRG